MKLKCPYCSQVHGENDGCVRAANAVANRECSQCHQRDGLHDPECKSVTCSTCLCDFIPTGEPLCPRCACYVPASFIAIVNSALQDVQALMIGRAYSGAPTSDPALAVAQTAEIWIKETVKAAREAMQP